MSYTQHLLLFTILMAGCGTLPGHELGMPYHCVSPVPGGFGKTVQAPPYDPYELATGRLVTPKGTCSSVLIGKTLILTALHCADADYGIVEFPGGQKGAVVQWYVVGDDAAVGELVAGVEGIRPIPMGNPPDSSHRLVFLGYGHQKICLIPNGYHGDGYMQGYGSGALQRGPIFSAKDFRYDTYHPKGWSIAWGDSGGPVIDLDTGKVVAIASGVYVNGTGMNSRIEGIAWSRFYEYVIW